MRFQPLTGIREKFHLKKGFCCAYHVLHGQDSCSNAVKNVFYDHGTIAGILSVFSQAKKCYSAYVLLSEQKHDSSSNKITSNKINSKASFCTKWAAFEGAWCCFLPFIS